MRRHVTCERLGNLLQWDPMLAEVEYFEYRHRLAMVELYFYSPDPILKTLTFYNLGSG